MEDLNIFYDFVSFHESVNFCVPRGDIIGLCYDDIFGKICIGDSLVFSTIRREFIGNEAATASLNSKLYLSSIYLS